MREANADRMDGYLVQRPGEGGSRAPSALAVAVMACILASMWVWAFAPMAVTVDGMPRSVAVGTTVADLARRHLLVGTPGDLISVTGGIAARERGGPAVVTVDGRPAGPDTRLYAGAHVESARGANVHERAIRALVAEPVPVDVRGNGPDTVVLQVGAAGLMRATIGEVSRSVLTSESVRPAVPMILEHRAFPPGTKLVALTFDDGPWPGQTERVLDILRGEGVRATFFVVGMRAGRARWLTVREVAEGHVVGNHTQSHLLLGRATPAQVTYQMATGARMVTQCSGQQPGWFRAPGGYVTDVVRQEAKVLGERIAGWTVDPQDWRMPPAYMIVRNVMGAVKPGAIVLLHDGGGDRSATIAALPELIRRLKAEGYRFVTLDQMYPR